MRSILLALGIAVATPLAAQAPADYYDGAGDLTGERLRAVLHEIIDDHIRYPYTSSETDTWDIIHRADGAEDNDGMIRDLYRYRLFDQDDHWSSSNRDGWNREHSWPKSYGFADRNDCNSAYTDVHALFASDADYNEARGNIPYDWVDDGTALPVDELGFSNFVAGEYEHGSFEVWPLRRGDVARAMFYMEVRYDGGSHRETGCLEPDLRLTSDRDVFVWSGSNNLDVAYMGILSTLIEWHLEDPVDERERERHEVVYSFQGNRNPFIDRPEWICAIWACGIEIDLEASTSRSAGVGEVTLVWTGISGSAVDLWRNGESLGETENDGKFVDSVPPAGTYRYRLCESGTYSCAETAVSFHERRRAVRRR